MLTILFCLIVELPPQGDVAALEISEDKLLHGVRNTSEKEEQAMGVARGHKQSDKKRRKYHVKRSSQANGGLVKCDELSCSVSVRSQQTPSGTQKLQWVFKLYDMESAKSLDDHEVPTLMKSVCDMLSAQIARSRTPPAYKRFKVRLNIMQQQSRSKAVMSSQSRFVLRDVRRSSAVLCSSSHGDGCTSCATYGASDEQSTQLPERRPADIGNTEKEFQEDKLLKHVRVRQHSQPEQTRSSEPSTEQAVPLAAVSRPLQKSSKKAFDHEQQRDYPLSTEKKTSSRRHRRRSSLPSDMTANPSANNMVSKKTDQSGHLPPPPVKLRHQRRGGSKRHSYHGAVTFQNLRHKHSELEHGHMFDNIETVTRQEVIPCGNGTSSIVHHHHHEHHHHHYHVYHQL